MIDLVKIPQPTLAGKVIALLEARRANELSELIRNYGGTPLSAPALKEEPVEDQTAIAAFLNQGVDVLVLQTGVGTRALVKGVLALGRDAEFRGKLEQAHVVVRGPKPTAACRDLGIRVDSRAEEPFTTKELLAAIPDKKRIAVQHYGEPNVELVQALKARGSDVIEVEVYKWALPDDVEPMRELKGKLDAGEVDALVVTSQVQIRHFREVVGDLRGLNGKTFVVAVGPTSARAIREEGLSVDLEPEHPKMGAMVRELAEHFTKEGTHAAHS